MFNIRLRGFFLLVPLILVLFFIEEGFRLATPSAAPHTESSQDEWIEAAQQLQEQPVSKYSCLELTEGDSGKYFYRWHDSRKGMPPTQENCFMNVVVPEGYMSSHSDSEKEQYRVDVALENGWEGGVTFYSSSRSRLYQAFTEQTWLTSNKQKRSDLSMATSSDFLLNPSRVVVSDDGIYEELLEVVDRQRYRR